MKDILTKIAVLCSIIVLLGVGVSEDAVAKVTVTLTASMPWVNSDKVTCKQVSADGKVKAGSEKRVAWVLEYRGTDGQWKYQKSYEDWPRFSAGTTVPSLTGKLYTKCDQRLQLNPEGYGDDGKGGKAEGNLYIVK